MRIWERNEAQQPKGTQPNGDNTVAPNGAHPDKDDDEPAGYAGYFHYIYQGKRVAYLAKEHWSCREHGYHWVRDFVDANAALHWMNDKDDVPEDPPTLQHQSTPSPYYNSENSTNSGERYRRNRFMEDYEQDADSHHSIEGYFGYNERGQTGAPYYINDQGIKVLITDQPWTACAQL